MVLRYLKAAIAAALGRDIAGALVGGNHTKGPTVAGIRIHAAGQVDFRHGKIVATKNCAKSIELP
jgi:hypothetical protein